MRYFICKIISNQINKNNNFSVVFSVPFAVEERTGTITVVDDLENYNRLAYDFEAVVTNERELSLVTNVTIHVVGPEDETSVMMK